MPENLLSWHIWNLANARDRQFTQVGAGPIPCTAIIALCELYDATTEDFEKVLKIDYLLYKGPEGSSTDEEGMKKVVGKAANKSKPKTRKR